MTHLGHRDPNTWVKTVQGRLFWMQRTTTCRPCPSRAIGWLASPNRRVELRRVGFPDVEGALGLGRKGLGGTGVREAPSKKTSLRWALKEATARNQPWPGVDDHHYGGRDERANGAT